MSNSRQSADSRLTPSATFDFENDALKQAIDNKFFIVGNSHIEKNLVQFKKDFNRLKFTINGNKYTDWGGESITLESVAKSFQWENRPDDAKSFIESHSQGPFGFLPFILAKSILDQENMQAAIAQPTDEKDYDINIQGKTLESLKLVLLFHRIPIKDFQRNNSFHGYIEHPVTVTFNIHNQSGEWGWLLESVYTTHPYVKRILKGEMLTQDYLINNLCTKTEIKITAEEPFVKPNYFISPEEISMQSHNNTNNEAAEHKDENAPISSVLAEQPINILSHAALMTQHLQTIREKYDSSQQQLFSITELVTNTNEKIIQLQNQLNEEIKQSTSALEHNQQQKPDTAILELQIRSLESLNNTLKSELQLSQCQVYELNNMIASLNAIAQATDNDRQSLVEKGHNILIALGDFNAKVTLRLNNQIKKISQLENQLLKLNQQRLGNIQAFTSLQNRLDIQSQLITQLEVLSSDLSLRLNNQSQQSLQLKAQLLQLNQRVDNPSYQPVYRYLAAAVLSTGLSILSGLTTFGILNISIAATIPLVGWAIATGFTLALAGVMLIKSISNTLTNRNIQSAGSVAQRRDVGELLLDRSSSSSNFYTSRYSLLAAPSAAMNGHQQSRQDDANHCQSMSI